MNNSKVTFVVQARETATRLADVLEDLKALQAAYDARAYGPGAASELVAADYSAEDAAPPFTPDDLYSMIILADHINKFVSGDPATSVADRRQCIHRLRRDL